MISSSVASPMETSSSLINSFSHPDFCASLLQRTLRSKDTFSGKSIHCQIIKSGVHVSLYLINNLLNVYAKCGSVTDAHTLFDEMTLKNTCSWNTMLSLYSKVGMMDSVTRMFIQIPDPDSVSWTSMIVGYNKMNSFGKAIRIFAEMISHGVPLNQYTITNVLSSCAAADVTGVGREIHCFVVKLGFSSFVSIANSLLNMYAKCGDPITAKTVFDRMKVRSVSSWNALISLYMQSGRVDLAAGVFVQMVERDIVSWNSIITGYSQHGFEVEALDMFSRMLKDSSLSPNKFTFGSALSACANLQNLRVGKQLHGHITRIDFDISGAVENALVSMYSKCGEVKSARSIVEQRGFSSLNVIASTALLDGYVKVGDMPSARLIFDMLRDRDVIMWTAMIVGYVQNGLISGALSLFRLMIQEGPKANNYTFAAMLSVSSSSGSLDHGKQIHAMTLRSGEASSTSVSNALINMYSRAGNLNAARRVFYLIPLSRDTVSWTSMIIALAQHGHGEDAIELFEKMQALGIKPDHITYVGVLSACIHVGMIEKGRSYYQMMSSVHDITPTSSHYACMIDLLGRAGLFQEAMEFIEKMPIEPDVVAWGSLLSSCKVHKNPELAKFAAEKLFLIDPENSGAFSALANVYSACGRWEETAKVRDSMKKTGVKKEQGFSWLNIKNEVHVFGVEDSHHPRRKEIYAMMAKIWEEIKKMGFVPDTQSVLHDLDDEVKEQILRHHSEKLAIAYGLISTPENVTLRIMKNLRVCNDCHSAIKFISRLVDREIVVRDATRFHHFKDGGCSCRDYW